MDLHDDSKEEFVRGGQRGLCHVIESFTKS